MQSLEAKPLLLDIRSITLHVTHEEFVKLCQDNPDLRLELTKEGQLITIINSISRKISRRDTVAGKRFTNSSTASLSLIVNHNLLG